MTKKIFATLISLFVGAAAASIVLLPIVVLNKMGVDIQGSLATVEAIVYLGAIILFIFVVSKSYKYLQK